MNESIKKKLFSIILSLFGTAFLIYYIFRASKDVVSSDYMRIVYYYLDDVHDLKYLFSWEAISRIPITFLMRIINKEVFGYSVFFDKIIGLLGLFLFNYVIIIYILDYIKSKILKIITSVIVTVISFSLISWEMILNGTGYPHFMTVGLIALVFYLFDKCTPSCTGELCEPLSYGRAMRMSRTGELCEPLLYGRAMRAPYIALCILVPLTSLIFAGSYCVSFDCTIILFSMIFILIYIFACIRKSHCIHSVNNEDTNNCNEELYEHKSNVKIYQNNIIYFVLLISLSIVSIFAYLKSNNTGDPLIPVGFHDISLVEAIKSDLFFPIKFLLKSLASAIIGVETFNYAMNFNTISEKMIYFVGIIYLIIIAFTFIILIYRIYLSYVKKCKNVGLETTESVDKLDEPIATFPCMFLIIGLANFALVFLARYKFLNDDYGMSSRYGIQYMFLTIGVVLVLSKTIDDIFVYKEKKVLHIRNVITVAVSICSLLFIFTGHLTTIEDEIFKADYRIVAYEKLVDVAKNYENYKDDELQKYFEYYRDPEQIKHALGSLKKQKLNVFREK